MKCDINTVILTLARWLSWLEYRPIHQKKKDWGFDFWSGHIPRLWVRAPVGVHTGSNQSLFLSLSPYLPFSLKSVNVSSGEDQKENTTL